MTRDILNDLAMFMVVARLNSFTKAAGELGVSQSALSHAMKGLEERLGLRLLTRTTRSISPTPVGEVLITRLGPKIDEINAEIARVLAEKENPTGIIRISATDYAIAEIIWPRMLPLLSNYPNIHIELVSEYGLVDIVEGRFDAGVRLGDTVTDGMVSQRISEDIRFIIVATPDYFDKKPRPNHPRDLVNHQCINLRLPTHGDFYKWRFARGDEEIRVKVDGQASFSSIYPIKTATLQSLGLAYLPEPMVRDDIERGSLVQVLAEWCPTWKGYHIYYPHRRVPSKVFTLFMESLRNYNK